MATTTTRGPRGGLNPTSNPISEALALVAARLRLIRWTRHAARGALAGIGLALAAVALAHFDLLPDWLPLEAVLPAVILAGVGAGTLTAFLRPIPLTDAARLAEARLGLKERLSSALEFERSPRAALAPDAALLLRLQSEDAAAHARSLDAAQAVPWCWPWEAKAAFAGLVLLALALVLPNLPVFVPPSLRAERQIVQKTGDTLEKTATVIQKQAEARHLEETRKAAAKMQRLGKRLADGKLDKKQAMVEMSKLTQQMRQDQQRAAAGSPQAGDKNLAQAGQQLSRSLAAGGQKRGDAPAASSSPATPEVRQAAQAMRGGDPQALGEQLRRMADRTGQGKMTPAEQQQAAQDLAKLAQALQDTPLRETQQHAQAAAEALKRGDSQAAADQMRRAAQAAEREARAQADRQADQQAMQNAQAAAQDAQNQMAAANSAGDIKESAGQKDSPGQKDSAGQPSQQQGQGKGGEKSAGGTSPGNTPGKGTGNTPGKGTGNTPGKGTEQGQGSKQGSGQAGGQGSGPGTKGAGGPSGKTGGEIAGAGGPGGTGQVGHPVKHLGRTDPQSASVKLYFGKPPSGSRPSSAGPIRKVGSGPGGAPPAPSTVPYYNYVAPAKKSAETTMDKEDIPPAYRGDVRKYFKSLDPPAAPTTGGGGR